MKEHLQQPDNVMQNKLHLRLNRHLVLCLQCGGFHFWSSTCERYLWKWSRRCRLGTFYILISSWEKKQRWPEYVNHDADFHIFSQYCQRLIQSQILSKYLLIKNPTLFTVIKKEFQSGSVGSLEIFKIMLLSWTLSSSSSFTCNVQSLLLNEISSFLHFKA